jgi:hypothetical protein
MTPVMTDPLRIGAPTVTFPQDRRTDRDVSAGSAHRT